MHLNFSSIQQVHHPVRLDLQQLNLTGGISEIQVKFHAKVIKPVEAF